jgi:hypothetical protein
MLEEADKEYAAYEEAWQDQSERQMEVRGRK